MSLTRLSTAVLCALCALGCSEERKRECDKLLATMTLLEPTGRQTVPSDRHDTPPSNDLVTRIEAEVAGLTLHDQPLVIYSENYQKALTVLSNTIQLKESASAPDGTDDMIRTKVAEARAVHGDVQRYCAE